MPWNSMEYHMGIDTLRTRKGLRNVLEYNGISYKNQLPRFPQGAQECLGIVWTIVEYHIKNKLLRYPQGTQECLGIAWPIVEYNIKFDSLGTHKGLRNALE